MSNTIASRGADATRDKLLATAFAEFYRNGFQGGSLNHVVEGAGVTKGALFHHFAGGKKELGYAVVDEIIGPVLARRWLTPLIGATDPITELERAFRRYIREDIDSGSWVNGCPLNNLAQEMSPLDEGFRTRIDALYATWRETTAAALTHGVRHGTVARGVDPIAASSFIVAAQMGIWGTGKYSCNEALVTQATDSLCDYLDTLRA